MAAKPSTKLSREEFRKQKDLEEARKAGTAPAEVDESGRDINPHIPQYIKDAPWYLGFDRPTLTHQRVPSGFHKAAATVHDAYERGGTKAPAATKFRKGACDNCGAMTHARRDCLERPRKTGARFTGADIAPDERVLPDLPLDYEGKHDRWAGYDPAQHRLVVEEFEKTEALKRKLKAEKLQEEMAAAVAGAGKAKAAKEAGADDDDDDAAATAAAEAADGAAGESSSSSGSESDEEDRAYAEKAAMPGTKIDAKRRITVRNLRIREDTAKYLRNLDPNSAYYDPKTRTMRANPYEHTGVDPRELTYAGDNFVRYSGETQQLAQKQLFAWDAAERGMGVHMQANPTMTELMQKRFEEKKDTVKALQTASILEKYGGEEHLQAPPPELLMAQSEYYAEYSKSGRVVKGQDLAVVRSKYEEDVFPGNHTSVFGSYWHEGRWGFACCHGFDKRAYCVGEAGKAAAAAARPEAMLATMAERKALADAAAADSRAGMSLVEQHKEARAAAAAERKRKDRKKKKHRRGDDDGSSSGSSDDEGDDDRKRQKRIRAAMKKQEEEEARVAAVMALDERKRPYNALGSASVAAPTEEEMEAYRLRQRNADDPMNAFM